MGDSRYSVVQYDGSFRKQWDAFVDGSRNGTLHHKQQFLSYHPPGRYRDNSLIVKKRGKVIALFPAADVTVAGMRTLFSHPGASHGGLVVPFEFGVADAFEAIDKIIEYAAASGFDAIEVRPVPKVFQKVPSEELDFALTYSGFRYSKRELTSVIPVGLAEPLEMFDRSAVWAVKKALKGGVQFKITSEPKDYEIFYTMLVENLKERHGVAHPAHSLDELLKLRSLFPDDILLLSATLKGRPIGFLLVFVCNSKTVQIFYTAQDFRGKEGYRPINFIYYNLIKWAKERGFDYIDIGISTEEDGKIINWSLFNFKETMGGRGVRRDSYIIDLRERSEKGKTLYDPSSPEKNFDYYLIRQRHEIFKDFAKGRNAIELGCATGFSTLLLTTTFKHVVTVELDGENIEASKKLLGEKGSLDKVRFIASDWADMAALPAGTFSDIVWFGGAESVAFPQAGRILRRLKERLAKGGRLHVSATNRLSMNRRLGLHMGILKDSDEFSVGDILPGRKKWLADRQRLAGLITDAGYRIIHEEPYFLKPLPNSIMQGLPEDVIYGFSRMGRELPDYCAEIYICAEKD